MPISLIQVNTSGAASASIQPCMYSSSVTAGNLLLCAAVTTGGTNVTVSVSDSQGNAWTQVLGYAHYLSGSRVSLWYTTAGSSGGNTVFVSASAAVTIGVVATEYSGAAAPYLDGASLTNTSVGMTGSTGPVPVSQSGDLVVGVLTQIGAATASPAGGFTIEAASAPYSIWYVDQAPVNSSTAAVLTWSQSTDFAALGASFFATGMPTSQLLPAVAVPPPDDTAGLFAAPAPVVTRGVKPRVTSANPASAQLVSYPPPDASAAALVALSEEVRPRVYLTLWTSPAPPTQPPQLRTWYPRVDPSEGALVALAEECRPRVYLTLWASPAPPAPNSGQYTVFLAPSDGPAAVAAADPRPQVLRANPTNIRPLAVMLTDPWLTAPRASDEVPLIGAQDPAPRVSVGPRGKFQFRPPVPLVTAPVADAPLVDVASVVVRHGPPVRITRAVVRPGIGFDQDAVGFDVAPVIRVTRHPYRCPVRPVQTAPTDFVPDGDRTVTVQMPPAAGGTRVAPRRVVQPVHSDTWAPPDTYPVRPQIGRVQVQYTVRPVQATPADDTAVLVPAPNPTVRSGPFLVRRPKPTVLLVPSEEPVWLYDGAHISGSAGFVVGGGGAGGGGGVVPGPPVPPTPPSVFGGRRFVQPDCGPCSS